MQELLPYRWVWSTRARVFWHHPKKPGPWVRAPRVLPNETPDSVGATAPQSSTACPAQPGVRVPPSLATGLTQLKVADCVLHFVLLCVLFFETENESQLKSWLLTDGRLILTHLTVSDFVNSLLSIFEHTLGRNIGSPLLGSTRDMPAGGRRRRLAKF